MDLKQMAGMLTGMKLTLTRFAPPEITKELVMIWNEALRDFSDDQIKQAFNHAIQNLTEFPAPATIKRFCQGTISNDQEIGQEVAGLIESAIRNFGYTNMLSAKKTIGELGWKVVERCGGWVQICEVDENGLVSMRKLWRDTATQMAKSYHSNVENIPPKIPETPTNQRLAMLE